MTPAESGINNDDATGKVTDHVAGNVIGDKVAKIGDKCGDKYKKWR